MVLVSLEMVIGDFEVTRRQLCCCYSLIFTANVSFISKVRVTVYPRLTWKCEVGAQWGLKRLIWGEVVFFKGFNVKSCGFRGWGEVLECPQRDTNP